MSIQRILKFTLLIICVLFLALQTYGLELQASGTRVALVILLTILYYVRVEQKRLFFLLFLLFFTFAEIVNFTSWFAEIDYENDTDYYYYGANALYIISYVCLTVRILMDMNLREIISKYWIHIVILAILDVFCVTIVTGTTQKLLSRPEYILEFIYNSVIMILLTVAMINYISKNTQKSMNLLLGAIFIFFSEVLQMTYFYISDIHILNIVYSLFLVLAFFFLYLQARIPVEEVDDNKIRQDLTA